MYKIMEPRKAQNTDLFVIIQTHFLWRESRAATQARIYKIWYSLPIISVYFYRYTYTDHLRKAVTHVQKNSACQDIFAVYALGK